MIDVELTEYKKSSFLTVLYGSTENPDSAGNNIFVFDEHFEIVFELHDTQHYYTSTFKWISSSPQMINVALIEMLSRQVHLITISISQVRTGGRCSIHYSEVYSDFFFLV